MAFKAERGRLLYNEIRNRKARRIRLTLLISSILSTVGLVGLAIIVLVFTFLLFSFPFYVQAIGSLLAGALIYWSFLAFQDYTRVKKALKWLKVYELGVRLPSGSEEDITMGIPPRFIPFTDIQSFYPNEGKIRLPYLALLFNEEESGPIIVEKELIGNWGKFRKAVKGRMETHKGWYFLKGEGPVYAGHVESDDLNFTYGPKDNRRKLSWDEVAETPKTRRRVLKNLVVLILSLREGGKLKFLLSPKTSELLTSNYKKYVERFWESPEEEEERWSDLEEKTNEEE